MQEIGSEFWCVETSSNICKIFPKNIQWYLSGRSALQAIVRELGWARSVSMPAWLCDSMVKPFADAGIKVNFYPVYTDDNGLVQEINCESDILFLIDYFGYGIERENISHPCIIRDITHSLFSGKHRDADYCFGSLRKWCGVWTGGYAWTKDGRSLTMENADDSGFTALRSKAMQLKDCYVNRKTDNHGNMIIEKAYLDLFGKAEGLLESTGISPAADRDIALAKWLDAGFIQERRRANAEVLMNAFASFLIFPQYKKDDCPMFVPILVPEGKRDRLRSYLIRNNIYCPVHWPIGRHHELDDKTRNLYDNELSLVCDQRYDRRDMYRIADVINTFLKEG